MSIYEKSIKYIWKTLDPYDNGKITFGQLLDNSPIKIWHIILIILYILSIYRIIEFDGRQTFILNVAIMYVLVATFAFIIILFGVTVAYLIDIFNTKWYNLRRKTVLSCKRQNNLDETLEE
ncbi:MAG: hypothetical protein KAJ19_23810 [Gammaproteobacteria bacterium]|nr:hypothetical protein [Gammaproteobacteria bacterium]